MPATGENWIGPDGQPRYEILENPHPGEFVAYDRLRDERVLLRLGGEDVAEAARIAGRLEHRGALPVYDVGRDPEGRAFFTTLDPGAARSVASVATALSREQILRAVVDAAHVAAHAATRDLVHPRLGLEQVLRFPDGSIRVVGWGACESAGAARAAVRGVQDLLRRALAVSGGSSRSLRSIVRHTFSSAEEFACELANYLDGGPLAVIRLSRLERLAQWARRRPARATLAAGSAAVALAALVLAGVFALLVARGDREERWAAAARAERRDQGRIASARRHLEAVRELDIALGAKLSERGRLYHSTETLIPTEEEVGLDGDLLRLASARAAASNLATKALQLAPGAEADDITLALEEGRLGLIFDRALFEEGKTLSTSTIELARQTAAIARAIGREDLAAAREALGGIRADHSHGNAAGALIDALERSGGAGSRFSRFARALAAVGTLAVAHVPADMVATVAEVIPDEHERWTLGLAQPIEPGIAIELPVGVYLVQFRNHARQFAVEALLERGEDEVVDPGELPEVPTGFVWIPAASFYRGGEGMRPRRYRKDVSSVRSGFAIGMFELASAETGLPEVMRTHTEAKSIAASFSTGDWTGSLPTEAEWELAARGVAGRRYPWGDREIPGAANLRGTTQPPASTAIGEPATDRSIFGVSGLGGNVMEYTLSPAARYGEWIVKGGSFRSTPEEALAAGHWSVWDGMPNPTVGIRLCLRPRGSADGGGRGR